MLLVDSKAYTEGEDTIYHFILLSIDHFFLNFSFIILTTIILQIKDLNMNR
jgi:hypothetical protein